MRPAASPPREIRNAAAGMLRPWWPRLADDIEQAAPRCARDPAPAATTMAPTPPRGLTRRQAAAALGVSVRSIANYLRDGRLRSCHITSRAVRVPESEIARLLSLLPDPAPVPVHTRPPASLPITTERKDAGQ